MGDRFAIVRVKKHLVVNLPLNVEDHSPNPLAGPFDGAMFSKLAQAIRQFHNARKIDGSGDRYLVESGGAGRLEIHLTTDGYIFLECRNDLELVLMLFTELQRVLKDIAIEDSERGVLHNADSFRNYIVNRETGEHPMPDPKDR